MYNIIWPEYGTASEEMIRMWYADAIANKKATKATEGLRDPDEMARELHSIGYITLGRP